MDFALTEYLVSQQSYVESLLAARGAGLRASAPPKLAESMTYSLLAGGKRLRPLLCLAFADAAAQQSRGGGQAAQDAACAVEYVHTYSLVHDDLPSMDNDDLRRGKPTNHRVFGEAMAILAGDALLTDAFALLVSGSEGEASMRAALVRELAIGAGSGGMVGGQVFDIAEDRPAALDYLLRLHRGKTGALIKASCRMGVIAAHGTPAALLAADTYGEAVGLAFQIADDILDVTATAEALGKPAGADAAAGRHTFPAVVGLDEARRMAQAQVVRALQAVEPLEREPGPLAALARYSINRTE